MLLELQILANSLFAEAEIRAGEAKVINTVIGQGIYYEDDKLYLLIYVPDSVNLSDSLDFEIEYQIKTDEN